MSADVDLQVRPEPRVGISVHDSILIPDPGTRRAMLASIAAAGLDHVTVGDHVSFHGGTGVDQPDPPDGSLSASASVVRTVARCPTAASTPPPAAAGSTKASPC